MKDERTKRAGLLLGEAESLLDDAGAPPNWLIFGGLVALLAIFGAICFYLGRVSVELAPERLTVEGRMA